MEKEVCITFDDSLKCQVDVAYPVLKELNITAFWFIYSSIFKGDIAHLEIYKYFYNTYFTDFDQFYKIFKTYLLKKRNKKFYSNYLTKFLESNYLIEDDFYSESEREFRFFRDSVLKTYEFQHIMDKMLEDYSVDVKKIAKNLWMNKKDLLGLNSKNHVIGLHSFSHPTNMKLLKFNEQLDEYIKNEKHIYSVTGKKPITVSHPCGSYNKNTIKILNEIGIRVGFRADFQKLNHTNLEFPRVDHSCILSEIK